MGKDKKTVAVIGLGYVGLPLALLVDRKGYQVIGIDLDKNKVKIINKRKLPFVDKEVERYLKNSRLEASSDVKRIKEADIIIICVPTPIDAKNMPNLKPLKKAAENIAGALKAGALVILESTVNPGVCDNIIIPRLERGSGLTVGEDIFLAHCPERINPGDAKWNVENINRVVGANNKEGLERAREFYQSIITGEITAMGSLKEAEAVKIVENTFRDINIAFANELAKSLDKMDIDAARVIDGAATKPFGFIPHYPGCGIGGHCIPVDPYYLIEQAKENGFDHKFLKLAREINNSMPGYTADLATEALNRLNRSVSKAKIGVLGLAYKPEIGDTRESPAYEIINLLEERGAEVLAYDPYVAADSSAGDISEILDFADLLILATAHKEFKDISPLELKKSKIAAVIDGRNAWDKDKISKLGIIYKGIGR